MDTQKEYYSPMEIIESIKSFVRYSIKKWWLLVLLMVLGFLLGWIYFDEQRPKYEAVTSFILEEKSGGGGGLSGIASQFGFNLGGIGDGGLFSVDNILNILKSKKIVGQVLLTRIDSTSNLQTLGDLYLDFTGLKDHWKKNPTLANFRFLDYNEHSAPLQDSVLNVIYQNIIKKHLSTEKASKQGSIINVKIDAANSVFARLMSERLVQEAGKMYLDIRVGATEKNIKQLQNRSDSLLLLLNSKSYRAAASQPLDINPGIRTATVPVEIANRDKAVLGTLYAEVTKNLEANKLLLSQQTPVIQVLDRPGYLLDDRKKNLLFIIGVFEFAMLFLTTVCLFILFVLNRIKEKSRSATSIKV